MYRDIILNEGERFNAVMDNVVDSDIQAYRIVYKLKNPIDGILKITAKRADGIVITDTGVISGDTGYYVLKNNIYSKRGLTFLRVAVADNTGAILTRHEIVVTVLEPFGEADIEGDDRLPALSSLIIQISEKISEANNALSDIRDAEGEIQQHITDGNIHVLPEQKTEWDKISEIYKGEIELTEMDNVKTAGLYRLVFSSLLREWFFVSDSDGAQKISQFRFFNTGGIQWRKWMLDEETYEEKWSAWERVSNLSDLTPILRRIIDLENNKIDKQEAHNNFSNAIIGSASGQTITLTDVQPDTDFRSVILSGETTEIGEGEKSPNNPYVLQGVENAVINVSDGTNSIQYPVTALPLYSLLGGTRDTYDLISGTVQRRVAYKTFDGSEDWRAVKGSLSTATTYRLDRNRLGMKVGINLFSLICSHYPYYRNVFTDSDINKINTAQTADALAICASLSEFPDVAAWKAYLATQHAAGTPLSIIYELETPTTSQLTPQTIPAYSPTTVISTDKGSLDVKYNRDINTAFADLQAQINALTALGGML